MKRHIGFKAGPGILEMIRDEGLSREKIGVFAGPAGGPKWFVSAGFDRALMKTGFLRKDSGKVLMAGASAGGWRCLAMACKDPIEAYENLRVSYSRNIFTRQDTPLSIARKIKANVDDFLTDDDIPHILNHPHYDLAIHTVLSRGFAAASGKGPQAVGLAIGALANIFTPTGMDIFHERIVFYTGADKPPFLKQGFRGRSFPLNENNIRQVALATGSLPYIIAGVPDIPDAPQGVYRDGGLIDYQLNQDYSPGHGRLTLFFHYQEKIVPGWMDKRLKWRRPPKAALDRLLQVYPTRDFLDLLPDKRLPDRKDFIIFVDDPQERIRRFDEAARHSEILGEEFMEAVESGRIKGMVEPIPLN
jgi:hypothetical protein